jgi:hypothetical protein
MYSISRYKKINKKRIDLLEEKKILFWIIINTNNKGRKWKMDKLNIGRIRKTKIIISKYKGIKI